MDTSTGQAVDNWLHAGGLVLASSDRAARALQRAYHQRRRAEGLSAWPAPGIHAWTGFARSAWEDRSLDGRIGAIRRRRGDFALGGRKVLFLG